MKIINSRIRLETNGSGDLVDITGRVAQAVEASALHTGSVLVFVVGFPIPSTKT